MSEIPNLWSKTSRATVTPLAALRAVANGLAPETGGVLKASVNAHTAGAKAVHALVVEAPVLDQRFDVLRVEHLADAPYPARGG